MLARKEWRVVSKGGWGGGWAARTCVGVTTFMCESGKAAARSWLWSSWSSSSGSSASACFFGGAGSSDAKASRVAQMSMSEGIF
jgi:hypothetical protein